jgi:hypothetical protein
MGSLVDAACTVEISPARNPAATDGSRGLVFRVAHSATSVTVAGTIPANCRGRYWRLTALGANVQAAFVMIGETAPTLVYGQASAMGTGHLAAAPTLVDGMPDHWFCPVLADRFVFVSASAAAAPGGLEAVLSGERTGK